MSKRISKAVDAAKSGDARSFTTLRNLRVDFASLVDSPANKGARVLLFKRDNAQAAGLDAVFDLTFAVAKKDEALGHVYGILSLVKNSAGEDIVDTQGDVIPVAELEAAAADFMLESRKLDAMHEETPLGKVFESYVSTPEKRVAQGQSSDDRSVYWWIGAKPEPETFAKVKSGELAAFSIGGRASRERVEKATTDLTALVAELEKAGRKMSGARLTALKDAMAKLSSLLSEVDDSMEENEMADKAKKSDTPEVPAETPAATTATEVPAPAVATTPTDVTAELAKRDAEIVALRKQADEATAMAKAERDARLTGEYVAKARTEFPNLPRKAEDIGPVLKRLDDNATTPEDRTMLRELLTAGNTAMKKVFTEIGHTGAASGGDAWGQIEAKAADLMKADAALTIHKARDLVMKREPELLAQHNQERRAAH